MRIVWTPDNIEKLRRLWATGTTAAAIGDEFGCSRSSILGKVHRLGLAPRRDAPRRETRARIMADIAPNPLPVERKPKPVRPVAIDEASPRVEPHVVGRLFLEAGINACRWMVDGPGRRLCCSARSIPGRSWCTDHARLVWTRERGHVLRSDGGKTISDLRRAAG